MARGSQRGVLPALVLTAMAALVASALLLAPRFRDRANEVVAPPPEVTASSAPPTAAPAPPAASTAEAAPPPTVPPAPTKGNEVCPFDMVYVEGIWCPFVSHRCEQYLGPAKKKRRASVDRCQQYKNVRVCEGRPHELKFCVDRYEYPNIAGVKPAVMVSYSEAARACRAEGKRLCHAMEWTYACEGKYTQPYTTGLSREPAKCNIDRRPKRASPEALRSPFEISAELERLDQRVRSGALADCVSPWGVHDTQGNVAEWVRNTDGRAHRPPYISALAGGHSERAVATCRYIDARRPASYRTHLAGFRCCADALDGRPRRRLMRKDFRLRQKRPILR